jgi:hypothetical protein
VIDTTNTDTISVNVNYTTQGAVNVIGCMIGHYHMDNQYIYETIPTLEFGNDNPSIYDPYGCEVNGMAAGNYAFTDPAGTGWRFTVGSAKETTKHVYYNYALRKYNANPTVYLQDENGRTVAQYATTAQAAQQSDTLLTFTALRNDTLIGKSSVYAISINLANKTIRKDVCGGGIGCFVEY